MKKYILGLITGLVISITVAVSATILYQANEIGFTPEDNNWNVNNLESALNDLYNNKGSGSGIAAGVFWKFPAVAEEQTFEVPISGNYKLEVWGAQGGNYNNTYFGGYGAYSVGTVNIDKTQTSTLYINVGGAGKPTTSGIGQGGYNGGGNSYVISTCNQVGGSGGGATHIATESGTLDQLSSYKGEYSAERGTYNSSKILIVAGGGGGAEYRYCNSGDYIHSAGGSGGGYTSSIESNISSAFVVSPGTAATQNSGGTGAAGNNEVGVTTGSFGKANQTSRTGGYTNSPGGGGGFYGGGASTFLGATGGSGYIGSSLLTNKHMTCYDCTESNDEHIKTQRVSNSNNKSETPTADYVKIGNGFAKITYLGNSN